jgi:hypothetical protein
MRDAEVDKNYRTGGRNEHQGKGRCNPQAIRQIAPTTDVRPMQRTRLDSPLVDRPNAVS